MAELKEAARELDLVARYLERWGSISISSPVASVTGKDFQFDPRLLTDDAMFANNRLMQGFSRSSLDTAVDLGAGIKVEPEIDPVPKPDVDTQPGERVEPPATPGSAKGAAGAGTAVMGNPVLTPGFGSSQRQTIRQTASDRFELGLHKFLSNPTDLPRDTKLVYLVLNVACQPGELTQRGYIGQVDVRVDWSHCTTENIQSPPRIVAVYPSMDSQGLDLHTSRRDLIAAAFSLAAAGKLVGATAFLNAASRSELDSETFSSLTSVTSYSRSGQHFGFELRPAFFGKLDPASRRAEAGYRLEPVTFPVVVLLAVDKPAWDRLRTCTDQVEELQRALRVEEAGSAAGGTPRDGSMSIMASAELGVEPQSIMQQRIAVLKSDPATVADAVNKLREGGDKAIESLAPDVQTAARAVDLLIGTVPRLSFAVNQSWRPMPGAADARQHLFAQDDVYAHSINAETRLGNLERSEGASTAVRQRSRALRSRGSAMQAQLSPGAVTTAVPDLFSARPLRVNSVAPAAGRAEQSNVFIIRGQGFTDGEKSKVQLELFEGQDNKSPLPDTGPFTILGATEEMIAVALDDAFSKTRHAGLTFRLNRDGQESFTPAFSIAPAPEQVTRLTLTRDSAGNLTGASVPQADSKRTGEQKTELQQIIEAIKALAGEPKPKAEQGGGGPPKTPGS
ncbi:MAG: hypothetical protein IT436_18535 [Phycisphaerales bacterium]|nr:hypothetical protein [Phycisphaerales bacterium]